MLTTEPIRYEAAGLNMEGRLVRPTQRSQRELGILLFPDAFGLGDHALSQAERFAALGHFVLASDLHGNARRLEELSDVLAFVGKAQDDPADIRERARGSLSALMEASGLPCSRIVSVGYCLGGTMALELARSGAPVAATIGLHCGLTTKRQSQALTINGPVLICVGAADPIVSEQERSAFEREMSEADADWRLHVYGGVVHSFTDPSVDRLNQPTVTRYNAAADRRSWASIAYLLEEVSTSLIADGRPSVTGPSPGI